MSASDSTGASSALPSQAERQNDLLSDRLLGFLHSGVSISLAAASRDGRAHVTKVQGCRVSADRRRITVFASRAASLDVLRCFEETGQVAAVFSMPATDETYQIKGHRPRVETLREDDVALLQRYRSAFSAQIAPYGFPPQMADGLFDFPADDLVAVSFEPHSIFDQTPGPMAGAAVGAS